MKTRQLVPAFIFFIIWFSASDASPSSEVPELSEPPDVFSAYLERNADILELTSSPSIIDKPQPSLASEQASVGQGDETPERSLSVDLPEESSEVSEPKEPEVSGSAPALVRDIPFYSQFTDIEWENWRGRSCGAAAVAMIVNYFQPGVTSPQTILEDGLEEGHFLRGIGWTHAGLVRMAEKYGLGGRAYDLSHLSNEVAYQRFLETLEQGPVIVSTPSGFDPQSPIPHLVVINGVEGDVVHYNDPEMRSGGGVISIENFKRAWTQRFILLHF